MAIRHGYSHVRQTGRETQEDTLKCKDLDVFFTALTYKTLNVVGLKKLWKNSTKSQNDGRSTIETGSH